MGIIFVLAFYSVALLTAAAVAAVSMGIGCYLLLKKADPESRKKMIGVSLAFPFACAAFAGLWFVGYAGINTFVFHRDAGIGDSWKTPLPNGYTLLMIDTLDQGIVYNPRTQADEDSVTETYDTVFGVKQLQISRELIFGSRDTSYPQHLDAPSGRIDRYFLLDTTKNNFAEFASMEELKRRAETRGVDLRLRDIESVYRDYRQTWFDYLAFVLLVLCPSACFLVLAHRVWRLRSLTASS